ncbi:MAG: FtsX-like permease family protein [Balneolales bacterium]
MNATSLIARRYLFSRKHITLITTLSAISISGVTVGTALLVVVLSVFNGFFDVIKSMLLSSDPDLRIESVEGRSFILTAEMDSLIGRIPEIAVQSPYIQGKALVAHRGIRDQVVLVKGIEPELFARYANINALLIAGGLELDVQNQKPGILLSEPLSRNLRLNIRDDVSLLSATGMQRALTQFTGPRVSRFEVRGIYSLQQVIDDPVIYIDIHAAQRLFDLRNRISGIDISLHNHEQAKQMKQILEQSLGPDFKVQTWYDLQRPLYDVMNLEKWGAYFILMIIVLVAALNIVGSMTMIVIQKQRDIGILRSCGFRKRDIMTIFFKQGWYIGWIGCILGGSFGLLLSYLQKKYELIKLAGSESFIISAYPVQILWQDVMLVLCGSMILCLIASWYPAVRAASIQPADAVRNE